MNYFLLSEPFQKLVSNNLNQIFLCYYWGYTYLIYGQRSLYRKTMCFFEQTNSFQSCFGLNVVIKVLIANYVTIREDSCLSYILFKSFYRSSTKSHFGQWIEEQSIPPASIKMVSFYYTIWSQFLDFLFQGSFWWRVAFVFLNSEVDTGASSKSNKLKVKLILASRGHARKLDLC